MKRIKQLTRDLLFSGFPDSYKCKQAFLLSERVLLCFCFASYGSVYFGCGINRGLSDGDGNPLFLDVIHDTRTYL